jgi:hypothetical protein
MHVGVFREKFYNVTTYYDIRKHEIKQGKAWFYGTSK